MKDLNPDTLVVVCGYEGDQKQIEVLMPYFVHHRCPVVVLSPDDSRITTSAQTGVIFRHGGKRAYIGDDSLERQRIHMKIMLEYKFNYFLMNDADSLCLSAKIPRYLYESPKTFWSNEATDMNPGPSHLPKVALQPPYFCSREVLTRIAYAKPADSYYGHRGEPPVQFAVPTHCIDHYLLQLAHGAGVAHANFRDGCSFETGSDPGLMAMAREVQSNGKIFVHSVKSKDRLNRLEVARSRSRYKP